MKRLLIVMLLVCGVVLGEDTPPSPPPAALTVLATPQVELGDWVQIRVEGGRSHTVRVWRVTPGADEILTRGLLALANGDYALVAPEGTYRVEALALGDGESILTADAISVIGDGSDPTPPDPLPVVPGQRWVVLIRETADSTPALAQLVTSLRTSAAQKYADEKGHKLLVLDDDAKTPLGQPLPEMQAWTQYLASKQISLPAVVVVDPSRPGAGGVLFAGSAPKTADEILSLLKAHGG